jgi:uncharacterized membrane protein YhhN
VKALPLFLAALVAGTSYMASWALPIPDWAAIAWKGMGVGLLATWASRQGSSTDHRLLALVLTLGATADMVLELNFVAGAAIFALGHVVAIVLYYRNRMPVAPLWQRLLAFVVGVFWLWGIVVRLVPDDWQMPVAVYSLFLSGMLLMAACSRFPLAAAGAALFVFSDGLIFARMGPLEGAQWADFAIWATYFAGQALIAWGVAKGLDGKQRLTERT